MKPVNYASFEDFKFDSVNEPMAVYLPSSFIKSNVLDNLAKNSKDLFNNLLKNSGLTIKTLSENIFEITPKTFIKYKNSDTKIPSRITEIALELNTLYDLGLDLFGSSDDFNKWLNKKNMFFDDKLPASFLNTSTGIHLVYETIKRIEFGATA